MSGLVHYNAINSLNAGVSAGLPGFAALKKMYGWFYPAATIIDRTENLVMPTKNRLHPACRLPKLRSINMTYRDCCNHRAHEIWNLSDRLGVPISIMWSGGIDSTRTIVSFLENFPQNELADRVKILATEFGKVENPHFYYRHILPNFQLSSSEMVPWLFDKSTILVTGELNDQLFGSDIYRHYYTLHKDYFNLPLKKEQILVFMERMISDKSVTNFLFDSGLKSAESYGVTLEKNSDWWWWWNFSCKWQFVYMRLFSLASPRCQPNIDKDYPYLQHFFDSENFQLWSINNPQIRIFQRINDYKMQARKEIYEFDRNENYFINKSKKGSLFLVFSQRLLADAIDEDFNFYEKPDFAQWYEPNNSISFLD